MEIKGPGRITPSGVSRKGKKKGSDKTAFGKALSSEETTQATPPSGTSPLTAVSSLLSLQELPTSSEGRSKGVARAEDLLQHLEIIRHGLLAGQIPKHKLKDVVAVISREQEMADDPNLRGLLDDVELRVKVELAKLEMIG